MKKKSGLKEVRKFYNTNESFTDETINVREFEVEPAHVSATYSIKVNLGNYESAGADCTVTLPCYIEEIPEAFNEAWKLVNEEIAKQAKGIQRLKQSKN